MSTAPFADNLSGVAKTVLPPFSLADVRLVVGQGREEAGEETNASHAQGTFALFFPPQILTSVDRWNAPVGQVPPPLRCETKATAAEGERETQISFEAAVSPSAAAASGKWSGRETNP